MSIFSKCPRCGWELDKPVNFCAKCGTPVNHFDTNLGVPKHTINSLKIDDSSHESNNSQNNNKLKLPIIITVALLLILFIGGTVFILKEYKSQMSNKYSNNFNSVNGSYIARNDQLLFYINQNNGAIIRMNSDGSNKRPIIEGYNCSELFILGKTLFFLSGKDKAIYSSDFEGANLKKIAFGNIGWFNVTKNIIYYIDGYYDYNGQHGDFNLYRIKVDGREKRKLTHVFTTNVNITEDSIIFLNEDNNSIYSINFDGGNAQIIYSGKGDESLNGFLVYKDNIYLPKTKYNNESVSGIYTININSKDINKILTTIPGDFTFWNDRFIYVSDANNYLSQTNISLLDGSDPQRLLAEGIDRPIVLGDYLYYYNYVEGKRTISYINLKTYEQRSFEEILFRSLIASDRYLFFIDNRDNSIYRSDFDGGNIQKLTNSNCNELFYHDDSLFYLGNANGFRDEDYDYRDIPKGLFRLDQNGRWATWIDDDIYNNPIFDRNYVYYLNDRLYRTPLSNIENLEDKYPLIISQDDEDFNTLELVIDNWIYVFTWASNTTRSDSVNGISRISIDGNTIQPIIKGSASQLQLYNGNIYYVAENSNNNCQLRKINLDGTHDQIVIEEQIKKYIISDDIIYYIDSNYYHIYRINIDGTRKEMLTNTGASDIVINNGNIYYADMYDHGAIYLMDINSRRSQKIIDYNYEYSNSYNYQTEGVETLISKRQTIWDISYTPTDILTFEDPEFEKFLSTMFNKPVGSISGADLLSVKFLGYYEGAPTKKSSLTNYGTNTSLFENCVFFSTNNITDNIEIGELISNRASGDTLTYFQNCIRMSVISNEWMASHVMPFLYYFKNLEQALFGYCWVSEDTHLPLGIGWYGVNTHSQYYHDPY